MSVTSVMSRSTLRTRLIVSYGLVIGIAVAVFAVTTAIASPLAQTPPRSLPTPAVSRFNDQIDSGLLKALLLGIGLSLGSSVIAAVLITRRLATPLERVRAAARRMTDGHYDSQIPVPPSPELAGIASDLNALGARLDDTERRRTRLVSDLAHELRTPLTILRGRLDGVADGIFATSPELVTSMSDEVARLERLTDELSHLSRAEETSYDLRLQPLDLVVMARTLVSGVQSLYDEQHVALTVTAGQPALVTVDPDRISQVIVNLLTNALTATDPGGRVTVSLSQDQVGTSLRVTDTGCGIAPEHLERVFDRFERLTPPGRHEPHRGSGIGLTIARAIARAHGGNLHAHSAGPGTGAVFTLFLPADPEAAPGNRLT